MISLFLNFFIFYCIFKMVNNKLILYMENFRIKFYVERLK